MTKPTTTPPTGVSKGKSILSIKQQQQQLANTTTNTSSTTINNNNNNQSQQISSTSSFSPTNSDTDDYEDDDYIVDNVEQFIDDSNLISKLSIQDEEGENGEEKEHLSSTSSSPLTSAPSTNSNASTTQTTKKSTKSKSSKSSMIADKYHQIMLNQLGLAMSNGAQHAHMGTITNANMLVNPATMQPPPTSSIGQSCKYGEMKHRSLLAQVLSRTFSPLSMTGEAQNIHLAHRLRYENMQITDKIDTVLGFWNLVCELKGYTIDAYINSTTQSILSSNPPNPKKKSSTSVEQKQSTNETIFDMPSSYETTWSPVSSHKKQKIEKKVVAQEERDEEVAKLEALLPKEQTSKAYKNKGNELFQKKQYYDALLLYSEALRLFNTEQTKDPQILISIHSNRCLCLVHLEKFEEGAMEATRGLECNPEQLAHKLLYRRGICNFSLRRYNMAKKDFQDAHKLVSKIKMDGSDLQSIESYLEKIGKIKGAGITDSESNHNTDNGKDPESLNNQKISIVDSRVSFRYASPSLGRIAEATDDIKANTIIIKENAYVTCLDRSSYSSHCHNCFKETLAPIFCKKCNHSQYCSEKCLNEDFIKYHEMECSIGFLLLCSSEGLLTIRLLAQKAKERKKNQSQNGSSSSSSNLNSEQKYIPKVDSSIILDEKRTNRNTNNNNNKNSNNNTTTTTPPEYIINDGKALPLHFEEVDPNPEAIIEDLNLYHPNYDLIYSFDPHYDQHSNEKLVALIIDAFLIQRFLLQNGEDLGIPAQDVELLTIVRHLCQLSSYIYSIPVFVTQDEDQEPCNHGNIQRFIPIKIAYAIFPTSSLLNHSCDNNTILQYNGSSITIKSLKNISKNDEITACYGPHAFHLELRERLECLKEEYFFICRCHACNAKTGPNLLKCPHANNLPGSGLMQCDGVLLERVDLKKLGKKSLDDDDNIKSLSSSSSSYDDYNGRKFMCSMCLTELSKMDCFMLTSQTVMSCAIFNNATKLLIDTERNQPPREVEEMLFKCLSIRQQIYHNKSRRIGEVYDALSRYYIAKDKYKEAVNYAEKAVNNIYLRLGHSHSTELAREWAKLANIYINAGEPSKAIKAINTAESLLVKWKTEPSDDEILLQLRNHKKVLDASKLIPGTNKVEINLTQLWCSPDFDSDQFFHRMILYHKDKNNLDK